MSDQGFLGRWAKRKAEARDGVVEEPRLKSSTAATSEAKLPQLASGAATSQTQGPPAEVPLPSIESLTRDSDFAPFMSPSVSPEIRNRAVKKLFTDPHYNIMDGLDTYIDDYSNQEPLPAEWLANLVAAARPEPPENASADSKDTTEKHDSPFDMSSEGAEPDEPSVQVGNDALQQGLAATDASVGSLDSAVQQPLS